MSLNNIKKTFVNGEGRLRALWQLIAAAAVWFAVYVASAVGISRLILALFSRWGVTNANIALCPAWVQYLAMYQSQLSAVVSGIVCIAIAYPAMRVYSGKAKVSAKEAAADCAYFAAGVLIPMALMGIFLLTDSMRTTGKMQLMWVDLIIVLIGSIVTAAAECIAAFGYVRRMTEAHWCKTASCVTAAAVYCLIGLISFGGVWGVVNSLLIGFVLCIVSEKVSLGAVIALRAGFLWSAAAVAGFDGSGIFSLYPVSENLITGGYSGIECAIAVTLICVTVIFVLMRGKLKELTALIKKR